MRPLYHSILDDEDSTMNDLNDKVIKDRIINFLLSRFAPWENYHKSISRDEIKIRKKTDRIWIAELSPAKYQAAGSCLSIAWHQGGVENIDYFINRFNEFANSDHNKEGFEALNGITLRYVFNCGIKLDECQQWTSFKNIISCDRLAMTGVLGCRRDWSGYHSIDMCGLKVKKHINLYEFSGDLVGKCTCKQVYYSRVHSRRTEGSPWYGKPYVEFHTTIIDSFTKEEEKV